MQPEDQKAMPARPGRAQRMVSAGRRGSIACVRLTLHKLRQADRTMQEGSRGHSTSLGSLSLVRRCDLLVRASRPSVVQGPVIHLQKRRPCTAQQLCRWLHLGDLTLTPAQNLVLQGVWGKVTTRSIGRVCTGRGNVS